MMRIITAHAVTKRRASFLVSVFFGLNIGPVILPYRTCGYAALRRTPRPADRQPSGGAGRRERRCARRPGIRFPRPLCSKSGAAWRDVALSPLSGVRRKTELPDHPIFCRPLLQRNPIPQQEVSVSSPHAARNWCLLHPSSLSASVAAISIRPRSNVVVLRVPGGRRKIAPATRRSLRGMAP
jgi:hypothetical protein